MSLVIFALAIDFALGLDLLLWGWRVLMATKMLLELRRLATQVRCLQDRVWLLELMVITLACQIASDLELQRFKSLRFASLRSKIPAMLAVTWAAMRAAMQAAMLTATQAATWAAARAAMLTAIR